MKTNANKITIGVFGLIFLLIISLAFLQSQSFSIYAKSDYHTFAISTVEIASCNHDQGDSYAQYDIPDEYEGPIYIEDFCENGAYALAMPTINTTCEGLSSHGPGRESGNITDFLTTGCNSYRRSGYSYGSNYLPYFINTEGFTMAEVDEIERQANLWNQAVMHDGTGQIVTVERRTNTDKVNYSPVCQISRVNGAGAGAFWGDKNAPRIEIYNNPNGDTIIHEMGHFLGLRDTDTLLGVTSGTHKTLMGYNRGNSTTSAINAAIKYQDIQGIAIANSSHIHNFMRYVTSGSNRTYICFYCDAYSNITMELIPGSQAMADSATCTHTYSQMVSHGERHWHKCTKCYKVIETPLNVKGLTATTLEVTGTVDALPGNVTIPSTIGGQSVTSIGRNAFSWNTALSQISIPASVTDIAKNAFPQGGNIAIVVRGSSSHLNWTNNWNCGNPVSFSVAGGCGLYHNRNFSINSSSHSISCSNCTQTYTSDHNYIYKSYGKGHTCSCVCGINYSSGHTVGTGTGAFRICIYCRALVNITDTPVIHSIVVGRLAYKYS